MKDNAYVPSTILILNTLNLKNITALDFIVHGYEKGVSHLTKAYPVLNLW